MMVGHMVNDKRLYGTRGLAYSYLLAGNGLWIEAKNDRLNVRVSLAEVEVRGLLPADRKVELLHGKIPGTLFELAFNTLLVDPLHERFVGITWRPKEGYKLYVPKQLGTLSHLQYSPAPSSCVMEMHSHPRMHAFFSHTDNEDEQGFRIYGVVGLCRPDFPEMLLRLGVYGNYSLLEWDDVFDGPEPSWLNAEPPVEEIPEEVLHEYF